MVSKCEVYQVSTAVQSPRDAVGPICALCAVLYSFTKEAQTKTIRSTQLLLAFQKKMQNKRYF